MTTPSLIEPFLFELPNTEAALLCVHGLTSTPYSMRALGSSLASDTLSVYSVLLPGHGTHPDDLAGRKWEEWYEAVETGFLDLKKKYTLIFLCGQSLGALLILLLASKHSCSGIISISAGLQFQNRWSIFLPLIRLFKKTIRKSNGPDIHDPIGRAEEIHYSEIPVQSLIEMRKLLKIVKKSLPSVHVPVLWLYSAEDHVFTSKSIDETFRRIASKDKTAVLLPRSYHVATMDYDRALIIDHCRHFIRHHRCLAKSHSQVSFLA